MFFNDRQMPRRLYCQDYKSNTTAAVQAACIVLPLSTASDTNTSYEVTTLQEVTIWQEVTTSNSKPLYDCFKPVGSGNEFVKLSLEDFYIIYFIAFKARYC